MNFSKNLKFLREKMNLKQSEMALKAGFKQNQWSGYETGISFPKFLDLIEISKFFDISETDLIHSDLSEEAPKQKATIKINQKQDEILDLYKELVPRLKQEISNLEAENKKLKNELDKEHDLRIVAEEKINYKSKK